MEQAMRDDQYLEHELHHTYNKLCSTCFSEDRYIKFGTGVLMDLGRKGIDYKDLTIHEDCSGYSYR